MDFLDLPDELLLMIIEVGEMEVADGLALSQVRSVHDQRHLTPVNQHAQTCRWLLNLSESNS